VSPLPAIPATNGGLSSRNKSREKSLDEIRTSPLPAIKSSYVKEKIQLPNCPVVIMLGKLITAGRLLSQILYFAAFYFYL